MAESTKTVSLDQRPAWKALQAHYNQIHSRHLKAMFDEDPKRGERLVVEAAGLYFDYSKHRVTDETLRLLLALAEEVGLRGRIDAMFRGDKINVTEKRAVLHIALRAPRTASIGVDGDDVVPKVHEVLDRMADFSATHPRRLMERSHRQAHPQRHQYRHRWLRPRPGHGVRGVAPLQRPQPDHALRLQRRRHGFRRGHARPRSGRNAVHHFVQDFHHARDDDQRAYRARLVVSPRLATTRRWRSISSRFRPMPPKLRSSASTRRTCSAFGIGSAAATRWIPRSDCQR